MDSTTNRNEVLLAADQQSSMELVPAGYAAALRDYVALAVRREALSAAERELILVGINAAIHLFDESGTRFHIRRALAAGATAEQVEAVVCLVACQGQRTFEAPCADALYEEMVAAGAVAELSEEEIAQEAELRRQGEAARGMAFTGWESMLRMDAEFFMAYQKVIGSVLGQLSPRLVELLIVATDVVTTNLNDLGGRMHIARALRIGVTREDLLEVYELAAIVSYKSAFMGARILAEELAIRSADS